MKRIWLNLWVDDCGALLVTEWIIMATIIVLGVVPGLILIRKGLLHEMKDVANATMSLDQSYEFTGNEVLYGNKLAVSNDQRRVVGLGNGSITEIVTNSNGCKNGAATIVRRDVRPGQRDIRDPYWQQPRIARTAGSAFIQGNHAADGRDRLTAPNPAEIKDTDVETEEVATPTGKN